MISSDKRQTSNVTTCRHKSESIIRFATLNAEIESHAD